MRALVTGGTGFVWSNLVAALIYADGSKARDELGVPATPFRTAAKSAYKWSLENDYLRG
jgi:dihydroflavonol-4-reductase